MYMRFRYLASFRFPTYNSRALSRTSSSLEAGLHRSHTGEQFAGVTPCDATYRMPQYCHVFPRGPGHEQPISASCVLFVLCINRSPDQQEGLF